MFVLLFPLCIRGQGNFRDEYERFRQQSVRNYINFREQCNREYAEFLKAAWEYYQIGPAIPRPAEEEVPPVVIDMDRDKVPIQENELPIDEIVPVVEEEVQPQPLEPVVPVPVIEETWCGFDFFGTAMKVRAGEKNRFALKSIKGKDVSKAWEKLSGKEFDPILADCLRLREEFRLCDWAYLLLLQTFSDTLLDSYNEAVLLTAYLFCQSGYKMRLGATEKKLSLLFGTKHQIYGMPCFEIDGYYYYPLNGDSKGMQIANFAFPQEQGLSLTLPHLPLFTRDESDSRTFSAKGFGTKAACSVNKNLIEFFENYPTSQLGDNPMTRWAMYANTPIDENVKTQLYPVLKTAIEGRGKHDAAEILLDFVQTAFEYEYDDSVWGGDRAFFAEESLYYPYCDCEDRSILFSHLVRDLLELDVILVYYPGHLAAAVRFDQPIKGDYVILDGQKYVICDPTYIGAPVGVSMPDLDKTNTKVILLK